MTALLLAATLMMPGDFGGVWAFTSFRARPVRIEVRWLFAGAGIVRPGGSAVAYRDPGGPLVVQTFGRQCRRYVVTSASPDQHHLRGVVYFYDRWCNTQVAVGSFRAHRRR